MMKFKVTRGPDSRPPVACIKDNMSGHVLYMACDVKGQRNCILGGIHGNTVRLNGVGAIPDITGPFDIPIYAGDTVEITF